MTGCWIISSTSGISSVPNAPEKASWVARSASTSFLGDSSSTTDVSNEGRGTDVEGFSSAIVGRGTDSVVGSGTETGCSTVTSFTGAGSAGLETGSGFFS